MGSLKMHHYPPHLHSLIEAFKKLPGVGSKSAERFAFSVIDWEQAELRQLGELIAVTKEKIVPCSDCGCLLQDSNCPFCTEERFQSKMLCVIASPKDAYTLESTHAFRGLYHVLGGLISPLDGFGPEKLLFKPLIDRIKAHNIEEVVLALDSTIEGDATSLYLKKELAHLPLSISRLAFGMPMGSTLDYVDGSTLARALQARNRF